MTEALRFEGSALALGLALLLACAACGGGAGGYRGPPCPPADENAPDDVFCIGLYDQHDPTRIAADVHPYRPGVTLWSDGAEKQRYLALPVGTQIDTSNIDAWSFPVGTKAFKEFRFGGKLVETRMMWKQAATNWIAATYIWDDANTSATLNTSTTPVLLATGYEIPTAKDCGKCHHGGSDKLLGVEAVALALPGAQGFTLTALAGAGSLSAPPATTSITLPEDASGKAAAALGYLHANCGMPCHSTRGLGEETKLVMRIRADELWPPDGGTPAAVATTDIYKASVRADPTTASVRQAFPGAKRITPGDHQQSLVWILSARRGMYQMPPLVSHVVDETETQALAAWIDTLQ